MRACSSRPPRAGSTRSSWCSRARSRTRRSTARAVGRPSASTPTRGADPHLHVDRPAGAERGGGARDRHLCRLRRDPGDAQQPDRGDGPARLPRLGLDLAASVCRSSTCRAARSNPTTSPRRCCAWCSTSRASGPSSRSTSRGARSGSSGAPPTRAATRGPRRARPVLRRPRRRSCLVKLGCKGPVAKCNVPIRGWINGIGGCPNVGGICIACTMPGFPDKYLPFMEPDPAAPGLHGRRAAQPRAVFRYLREQRMRSDLRGRAEVATPVRAARDRLPPVLVSVTERRVSHRARRTWSAATTRADARGRCRAVRPTGAGRRPRGASRACRSARAAAALSSPRCSPQAKRCGPYMPRPCHVSQRPGSASTYSPWRRSSSWRSSASCVSGSGRASQISHLKTTTTGISCSSVAMDASSGG